MKTTCWMIDADGNLHQVEADDAIARWKSGQETFWIDLKGGSADEMVEWTRGLGLEPELIDLLQTGGHETKVLPLDRVVYFEYPVLPAGEFADPTLFGCLCLDRLVVTMHEVAVAAKGAENAVSKLRLHDPSTRGLVFAIILVQSTRLRRHVMALRDRSRKLADRMDHDPASVPLADILDFKHSVMLFDSVVSDQLAAMNILQAVDTPALNLTKASEVFQIALSNTTATDRGVDRMNIAARDLQQRFESTQQDKTNRRLAILTIMSAIFSPLTLIAGIYGMNFEYMPELGYHYAYFIVLGVMAGIAGGLYWLLRKRGWLK